MTRIQPSIACAVVFLAGVLGGAARAEDGVSDGKILFGQVAALTGPAQDLVQGMRQGILAAFDEANRAGGIAGRKLELELHARRPAKPARSSAPWNGWRRRSARSTASAI